MREGLTFSVIKLNFKENSIKQGMGIQIRIHNQQRLGISLQKKVVRKHKNGKIISYISKVEK